MAPFTQHIVYDITCHATPCVPVDIARMFRRYARYYAMPLMFATSQRCRVRCARYAMAAAFAADYYAATPAACLLFRAYACRCRDMMPLLCCYLCAKLFCRHDAFALPRYGDAIHADI